jgi:outer membrane protein assembly factor BamB
VVDDTSAVHALDKTTGASVWKQDKLTYRRLTSPVIVDRLLVLGDLQGYVHVISPDNGEIIGRVATDGTAVASLTPVSGGVLVQTAGGTVTLVRI